MSTENEEIRGSVTAGRRRRPLALAALMAAAVLAGCGGGTPAPDGGGGGGGGSGGNGGGSGSGGGKSGGSAPNESALQKIATCMEKEGATGVSVDAEGANLLPAESSTGAIVGTVEGIRVNVYAHRNDDDARDTNGEEKGSIKSFRDGSFASAWQRDPDGDQRDVVRDCLPKDAGDDKKKDSGGEDEKQQK